jgi:flagellar hook-associated protein 2
MSSYISGLSSGLDWQSMISQLMELEKKPITLMESNKTTLAGKKSAWSVVNTKLNAFKSASEALSSTEDFDVFSASASVSGTTKGVEDLLGYAVGTNAGEGSYTITINRVAQAQKFAGGSFASDSTALGISGTVTINGRDLVVEETDTLTGIQDKINALNSGSNPAGVTASIIAVSDNEYRLTLTSKNTGAAGISIVDESGVFSTQLGMQQVVAGQDAEIVVDGFTITRSTNQISDVIKGVTLNLKSSDEEATINLEIGRDQEGVKDKIQAFVDAYNDLMSYIDTQGTTTDSKNTNPLYADSSLRTVKSTLRGIILSGVGGLDSTLDHLSLVGVNIDKYGKLSIDEDKLDGYLQTNFDDVVNLFAADGSTTETMGVSRKLGQALDSMTDSIDGYVVLKQKSLQSQMDKIDRKIEDMEARLERKQEAMISKFAAMETMLSTLQSQQSWLESQIDSLNNKS